MTKVVFQIGVLAFCVSAVLFGSQGLPLFDIVARGFIVFIGVVTLQVVLLMVATNMKAKANIKASAVAEQTGNATSEQSGGTPPRATTAA